MHEYSNYSILSKKEIEKEYKNVKFIKDNIDVATLKSNFESTYGAYWDYTPSLSKDELENLRYWDPSGNSRNGLEMIYYQDYEHEVQADEAIYDAMLENFSLDELKALFIGKITRLSTDDAKICGSESKQKNLEGQKIKLDLIRGNDTYFTQMHLDEFESVYEDAIYILWDRAPFSSFSVSSDYKFKDEERKLDIFVNEVDGEIYINRTEEKYNEFKEFLKENYKYNLSMLGQGAVAIVRGIDKYINNLNEYDRVAIPIVKDDIYFVTMVAYIKASPTHGKTLCFIYDHNEDDEDYGYYY